MSLYSTVVTSGGALPTATETVRFPPGAFRFPFVPPGEYRLEVIPPAGYAAPSTAVTADLQALPTAPFALGPASYGQAFPLNPGPILRVDIPLDPVAGSLWLSKLAGKSVVAVGDFVPYGLTLETRMKRAVPAK